MVGPLTDISLDPTATYLYKGQRTPTQAAAAPSLCGLTLVVWLVSLGVEMAMVVMVVVEEGVAIKGPQGEALPFMGFTVQWPRKYLQSPTFWGWVCQIDKCVLMK